MPDEGSFLDLDKSCHGLTPISVDTWNGFVFICIDQTPAMSLSEFLDPMYGGLKDYPFERFTACYSCNTIVDCNWKVAIDAFQETCHVGYVHGRSIADAIMTDEDGDPHPIDGPCGDVHRRLGVAGNPKAATQGSAGGADDSVAGAQATGKAIASKALKVGAGGTKLDFSDVVLPDLLNWTNHPHGAFDINAMFPDFYLSCRPDYLQAYNFRPISHNKTSFETRACYPEMKTAGGRFYQEYMKVALRDVLLEDLGALEMTRKAAETGAKSHMILQDFEIMVRHRMHVVEKLIAQGQARDAIAAE